MKGIKTNEIFGNPYIELYASRKHDYSSNFTISPKFEKLSPSTRFIFLEYWIKDLGILRSEALSDFLVAREMKRKDNL